MLDIKTLMVVALITNVINAGAVAFIWRQSWGRYKGISLWLIGITMQVAGSLLNVLGGLVPDVVSLTLSNTIILGGVIFILAGLEDFLGKKSSQIHNYVLLLVFTGIHAYFSIGQPNLPVREFALSVMVIIYTFQCYWLLLHRVDSQIRKITNITGIVFLLYVVFNVVRVILVIIFPEQSGDFYQSGNIGVLVVIGYILLNLCLTLSLVLMVNRRLLEDVNLQEEKFAKAFHSAPYAFILTRLADGKIFEVNDGFVDIMGYQYSEVIGKTTLDINMWVRQEDRHGVTNELTHGREVRNIEYQFCKKSGEVLTGLFSANQILINNEKCILASISDITDRKHLEGQLLELATHDSLTGLPNRRLLYDRFTIAQADAQRNRKKVAIMSFDLDFFKKVNDLFGHDTGDKLLVAVANRLTGNLRKIDTVARIGGDEFVVLLWGIDNKDSAASVAEKIIKDFQQVFIVNGHSINISVSIGIAFYSENGDTVEELLKSSDKSLYIAKQNGRNTFVLS